jgi:NADPH:quinone reductase-like Zn-dependent oxidoreductase
VLVDPFLAGPRSSGAYRGYGGFATYAVAPAGAIHAIPGALTFDQACNLLGNYETAYHCLIARGRLAAGETVLVHGASGSVGLAAVHVAKLAGATVIASAGSEEKREVLQHRRADHVLDHHSDDLVQRVLALTGGEGATIVFEHIGQATWERSLELCAPGGTIVSAGATSGDDAHTNVTYMFVKQLRILGSRLGTMADTVDAARHLSAGRFTPLIGAVLPLERLGEAHDLMDQGRVIGKVIVKPDA